MWKAIGFFVAGAVVAFAVVGALTVAHLTDGCEAEEEEPEEQIIRINLAGVRRG